MSTQPTRNALLGLYGATLRAARSFKSYNFRNYFLQRTRDNFRSLLAETDSDKVSRAYEQAVGELAMLKRSAIVNQLYAGPPLPIEVHGAVKGGV
ncbi:hypothetical protein BKA82DRAFT_4102963 [Pisolithus tinctorius]|nr:hypothetical protein BKA82DRAFT_4102963 [Pisolithus tinctorius]